MFSATSWHEWRKSCKPPHPGVLDCQDIVKKTKILPKQGRI